MPENKLKVLVADDEKVVRDFFSRFLSLYGLEVLESPDGYKAIETVKQVKIDLFFIDVRMPGLNGLDVLREIKKIDPQAQVIMITGYAVDQVLEQARLEGAGGIIHKPFDINQVKDVIDKLIGKKFGHDLNILVIDDDEIILDFFINFLKAKDIRYKTARNKNDTLEALKKEKFDLVFLDIVFKEDDVLDIYELIKEMSCQIDIVLMTGYPEKANQLKDKIKVTGCLCKPFDIENILRYIEIAKTRNLIGT